MILKSGKSLTQYKITTSDKTKTSSETYEAVPNMNMTFPANRKIKIQFFLSVTSASVTPDMKCKFVVTGDLTFISSNLISHIHCMGVSGTNSKGSDSNKYSTFNAFSDDILIGLDNQDGSAIITLFIDTGASGGSLTLHMAQNTSNASGSTINEGSIMTSEEMKLAV